MRQEDATLAYHPAALRTAPGRPKILMGRTHGENLVLGKLKKEDGVEKLEGRIHAIGFDSLLSGRD